jgi:hypothetical protein
LDDSCEDVAEDLGSIIAGAPKALGTPLKCFRIEGIDVANLLDPDDPLAFNTGLSFVYEGNPGVDAELLITQTPITDFVDNGTITSAVPAPLPLFGFGMAFGWSRKLRGRLRRRADTQSL